MVVPRKTKMRGHLPPWPPLRFSGLLKVTATGRCASIGGSLVDMLCAEKGLDDSLQRAELEAVHAKSFECE
jgi:hypothetical protein